MWRFLLFQSLLIIASHSMIKWLEICLILTIQNLVLTDGSDRVNPSMFRNFVKIWRFNFVLTEKTARILTIFDITIELFQDFTVSHMSEFNRHFNLICIENTAWIFGTLHRWIGSRSENLQRYFLFGRFLQKSLEFFTLIITSDWLLSSTFLIFTYHTAVSLVTTFRHPKAWRETVGLIFSYWIFHENFPLL